MISLNTTELKSALGKVCKCAKNDKAAPLTQLLHMCTIDEHTLEFTTTDERNIFSYYIFDEVNRFEPFDVCILVDQITKLVSKFTSPKTELFLSESENELKLNGDGLYTISIPIDAEGNKIKYPSIDIGTNKSEIYTGKMKNFINNIKYCEGSITKPSFDLQVEDYPRTNYYVGDKTVALDGFLATIVYSDPIPFNMLISPAMVKILSNFEDDDFNLYKTNKYIVFTSKSCKLVSIEPEGLEGFPIEVAESIINNISGNSINISASVLSNALSRLNLFTEDKYDNSIKLKFNSNGMFAYTLDESCCETISSECINDSFECYINVHSLMSLIKNYSDDILTVIFGDEQCLKFVCDNISQIIVLSDFGEE